MSKSPSRKPARRSKASQKLKELLTQPSVLDNPKSPDANAKAPDGKHTYGDMVLALRDVKERFTVTDALAILVEHGAGAKSVRGLDPKFYDPIVAACNVKFGTIARPEDRRTSSISHADAATRKAAPIAAGFLDYFPDAVAAVAALSKIGNDQHNPGQPLHWARGKSTDEADCILRHLIDRGTIDNDKVRHSTKVAWRAMALLQKEIEAAEGLPVSRGSRA